MAILPIYLRQLPPRRLARNLTGRMWDTRDVDASPPLWCRDGRMCDFARVRGPGAARSAAQPPRVLRHAAGARPDVRAADRRPGYPVRPGDRGDRAPAEAGV